MKNIFQEYHLGQKVNCCNHGNGVIRSINMASTHPITVDFDPRLVEYKVDGTPILGELPTLSFGHKYTEFDYGTPEEIEFNLDLFMKGELARDREGRHVKFIGVCEGRNPVDKLAAYIVGDKTPEGCYLIKEVIYYKNNGEHFESRDSQYDLVGMLP